MSRKLSSLSRTYTNLPRTVESKTLGTTGMQLEDAEDEEALAKIEEVLAKIEDLI